jgi:hypothetical protein
MNKSTSNILMVVGFFAIVVVASMMFVKKTEAYQNAPSGFQGVFSAPTPFGGPMAPMRPIAAPTPFGGPMAPMRPIAAPTPFGGPMGPMGPMAPMRPISAPTPFGGQGAAQKQMQINAMMNNIQRIDTSLVSQVRNMTNNIAFISNTLKQRTQLEQTIVSLGGQRVPLPQEVFKFISRVKDM